ncbi:hypothetical protein C4544_04940 [candidate division WS5 bacterium]|uniref:CYTH domain-containing protein n=1 Tax=candidate division WS5 bacterium TaxID=2093353 RepID=A0A419DBK4_9BACT|nr:MAG: hypothetical protein C4544_04940 [candidate division WS5 bacterium]
MSQVTQHKTIELELRAEILLKDQESLKKRLCEMGTLHSDTKRMSVMCFGSFGEKKLDVRIRVTNGECEVVTKKGTSFGGHDREEVSQKINPDQFIGMIRIFSQLDFKMKVGERETINYSFPNDVIVSLVSAGSISYIELEKMSSKSELEENREKLKELADQLGLNLLKNEEEYISLCRRLDKKEDWHFQGASEDYIKLEELVNRYTK